MLHVIEYFRKNINIATEEIEGSPDEAVQSAAKGLCFHKVDFARIFDENHVEFGRIQLRN
jgi:hypothetical protein